MSSGGLIVFDVETTGTDPRTDQVIELCVQFGLDNGSLRRTWRIKPSVPISPGAQAVHGISMEDLQSCPSFVDVADEFRAIAEYAQIFVGYNLGFDIEMLQSEYDRLRQPPLDLREKLIIDPFRLWQMCEPRTLQDAHRRFCGENFDEAHTAAADVAATSRVLRGMLGAFGMREGDWDAIARVCEPQRMQWIGPSRHIAWSEDGEPVIGFGKHQDVSLEQIASGPDAGYLRWMLGQDFPSHVQEICRKTLELGRDELLAWIEHTFGPAPRVHESRSEARKSALAAATVSA